MTGHMGDETVTTQNLDVVRVDEARQSAAGQGRCSGYQGGFVTRAPRREGQGQEGSNRWHSLELLNERGQAASKVEAADAVFAS